MVPPAGIEPASPTYHIGVLPLNEGGVPLQATLILVDAGQPSVSVPRGTIPAERVPLLLSEK